jgi:hypothetical protein
MARSSSLITHYSLLITLLPQLPQLLVDHLLKAFQRSILQTSPVDKYGRDPANIQVNSLLIIVANLFFYGRVAKLGLKLRLIELEGAGDLLNFFLVQLAVILEQLVVKLPKFSLGRSRQGSLGGLESEAMIAQREILVNQFDLLGIFLEHLLE